VGFTRGAWNQVDATELPPGELVIGINPPFGFQNKAAIEFVEHALCSRPRLLALIFPTTNYRPAGYELLVHDERICRGSVFYTPGSAASNWINAKNVTPSFLLYRRLEPVPPPRQCHCCHKITWLQQVSKRKRQREQAPRPGTARAPPSVRPPARCRPARCRPQPRPHRRARSPTGLAWRQRRKAACGAAAQVEVRALKEGAKLERLCGPTGLLI